MDSDFIQELLKTFIKMIINENYSSIQNDIVLTIYSFVKNDMQSFYKILLPGMLSQSTNLNDNDRNKFFARFQSCPSIFNDADFGGLMTEIVRDLRLYV